MPQIVRWSTMTRVATALLALALVPSAWLGVSAHAAAAPRTPPNIVFIMLDDISTGYMDAMPNVSSLIADKGVEFTNGITPTSLCCPSRASTLSGKLAHTTGVYDNTPENGGWNMFQPQEHSTIATHLHDAGYRTGLFGKYLNGFGASPDGYVPSGWDTFEAFRTTGYYNWSLGGTAEEQYGDKVSDYSTDVLSDKAVQYVKDQEDAPEAKPIFLYFAPHSAHKPLIPAQRHIGTWHPEPLDAAFNEAQISDKPRFMRNKPLLRGSYEKYQIEQQKQHEMLMSADEGVGRIIDALGPDVSNTLFIVMGDNGYLLGSHRLEGKDYPYVRSARVPMIMRLDGVIDSTIADRLTTNTDLTATMAEVAGVSWPMDGISVLGEWRTGTVMEQIKFANSGVAKKHPAYCGYRTSNWLYVKWNNQGREELYRYSTDPSELKNLAVKRKWNTKKDKMRQLARDTCDPVPPGFTW